jgi:uncharacterized membrane protein SpoIIM required for sporulation
MILDLDRFIETERPYWNELQRFLARLESGTRCRLSLEEIRRVHYLYERTAADLAKLVTFAAEPDLRGYLEALVARAYGEIHGTPDRTRRFSFWSWIARVLPRTFRRHAWAFALASAVTLVGVLFGSLALWLDPEAKAVLMPFPHLLDDPRDRVAREEAAQASPAAGGYTSFSAMLMTHNTRVSVMTLALGVTWGVGTVLILFYNGIILGAVVADYLRADESAFLAGWLLPHGAIEIPAILIAGQAGLLLGATLLGRGRRTPLAQRLREITPDLVTLIFGAALLLVWAGLIEAFLSQHHGRRLPYSLKIAFGLLELMALGAYLGWAGREADEPRGSGAAPAAALTAPRTAHSSLQPSPRSARP